MNSRYKLEILRWAIFPYTIKGNKECLANTKKTTERMVECMRTKVFLALFLVVLLTTTVASQAEFVDLSFKLRVEAAGRRLEMDVYVYQGVVYHRIDGQLYSGGSIPNTTEELAEIEALLAEQGFELNELGETNLDGKQVAHSQWLDSRTGELVLEIWREPNSLFTYKTVVYNPFTEPLTMWITDVNYQPDFSQIDFSLAQEEPSLPIQQQQEPKEGLLPNNPQLRYP